MGFLDRFNPGLREHKRAVALLESKLGEHAKTISRLTEGAEMANVQMVDYYSRWADGSNQLLYPSGFASDRKGGADWPVLKDETDLRRIRSFCRLLCETNAFAIGFRDHNRNFVVGKGFTWDVVLAGQQTSAVSTGGEQDVDDDVLECQQVLDEFRRLNGWGDDAETRAGQDLDSWTISPANMEKETYERASEDGEAFVRLFPGDDGIPHLREIEPEQIVTPPGHDIHGPWGWGISHYCDDRTGSQDVRRIEAYHVADPYAPGQWGETVQAGHILHFKLNTKASVKRGISDFFPIDDELKGSKSLVRNMLVSAGILSAIAYIRQHAPTTTADQVRGMIPQAASSLPSWVGRPGAPFPGQSGPDATSLLTLHQAGQIIDVSDKLMYVPGPINAGVPGFLQAEQAALRCVGIRWGCPEYFTGDASNANFASTLVAGGPFERAAASRQSDFKLFQGQLAVRVLMFAVAAGRLSREQVKRIAVKVTAPPVAIANRKEDTERRRVLFDAKVLDPQTWCAEEGYDPAQVIANWKAWNAEMPDAGQQQQPGQTDPNATPTADDGDTGTDTLTGLFGESRISRFAEEHGAPPFPGAVFDSNKHRWVKGKKDAPKEKPKAKPEPPKTNDKVVQKGPTDGYIQKAKEIVKGKIKDNNQRAWDGKQSGEPIDIHLAGAIGEEIIIAHLKTLGYADADYTSSFIGSNNNNIPFDLIHDHQLVEAKTGQVGKPSGVWALKYDGRFNKDQEAAFAKMTPDQVKLEKKRINADKVRRIHERKQQFADGLAKDLKHKIKPGMITVIINPETKTADLYQFDGLHDSIGWNSDKAKAGYLKSVKYG